MVLETRRKSGFGGCFLMMFLAAVAYLFLHPVFSAARESAQETRRFDDGRRLALAVRRYAAGHGGRLPGGGWTDALEQVDEGLQKQVWRMRDGQRLGYAAVPGVLDRELDPLPPETVLFVETRSGRLNDIVHDLSELGGSMRKGTAIAVAAEDCRRDFPTASLRPLVQIGVQLARQHAPNLK